MDDQPAEGEGYWDNPPQGNPEYEIEDAIARTKSYQWQQGYEQYHEGKRQYWNAYREHFERQRETGYVLEDQKLKTLREYATKYHCPAFVETGTYEGNTPLNLYELFDELHTIEITDLYYEKAKEKFVDYPKITPLKGDSGDLVPQLLDEIPHNSLFWLDAHHSCGDTGKRADGAWTPVADELSAILPHPGRHVVLIDDACCFEDDQPDFPSIAWVKKLARENKYKFAMEGDIIRLVPVKTRSPKKK